MKKLCTFILLIGFLSASSQTCFPEGITFSTQASVDNFQINNPGCTEILGNVTINSDVENLNGLNAITSIGGNLIVEYTNVLLNLSGLENLTSIGGELQLRWNQCLVNLSGLNNVTHIGGDIEALRNDSLENFTGLESLNMIERSLIIGWINSGGNPSLTSLAGLDNITMIGENLRIDMNDKLESISNLGNLTFIGGDMHFYSNSFFTLNGLENVSYIGGDVSIQEYWVSSLEALSNITSIIGNLYLGGPFSGNSLLTDLEGLNNITSIGGHFRISQYDAIKDMSGMENLSVIGGSFRLFDLDSLASLSGLESLDTIGGSLIVGDHYYGYGGNLSLVNFTGLNNLESIGGDFVTQGNEALINYSGVESLTSIGGELRIGSYWGTLFGGAGRDGNPRLKNLNGLNNLTSIGGSLEIYCNDSLLNLSGLENLDSIGGALIIGGFGGIVQCPLGNPMLSSLVSLEGLSSFGGYLKISANDTLRSLYGLENLDGSLITDLVISENQRLSICEIESVCTFLADPSVFVTISNNATGCNTIQEVEDACGITFLRDPSLEETILLYPNPACHSLTIKVPENQNIIEANIYNTKGQLLIHQRPCTGTINISRLQAGMYIAEVLVDKRKIKRKLFVQ